jgi:arginine-tRNA-protein transferase
LTRRVADTAFFLSAPHRCGYLPGRTAGTLLVDPSAPLDSESLGFWTQNGFRRSGDLVYRPLCPGCRACVPVRVPVARFAPSRSQRRLMARNRDLVVSRVGAGPKDEHFALYRRYQRARHRGGDMDDGDPESYRRFLFCPGVDTELFEHRLDGRLLAVAVADCIPDGLSAAYTFFDPSEARRSLGTWSVLWLIDETARRGLPHLYLGYRIEGCAKMSYKNRFRPLEAWSDGIWEELGEPPPEPSSTS